MSIRSFAAFAVSVILGSTAVSVFNSQLSARTRSDTIKIGDVIDIAVPQSLPIDETVDRLIYVGRPGAFLIADGCVGDTDLRREQTILAIDPGEDEARRIVGIVTLARNGEPFLGEVPNGSRLGNLQGGFDCDIGGVAYRRFAATVE